MTDDPLRAAVRQCRHAMGLLLAFGFVINLLFLVSPLYMIQVFDRVLASRRVETLLMLTLIMAFALLILGILETVRQRMLTRIGNWLETSLSAHLIESGVHAALTRGGVTAQAVRDVNTLRNFIAGGLKNFLDLPWMPLFLAALWLLHPALGAFAIGAAVLLLLLALLNQLLTDRPAQTANNARVANEALAEQAIRNADVLKAMGMLPRFLDIWTKRQNEVVVLNRRTGDRNALISGFTKFARLLAQTGMLGLGAYFVIAGDLTAGAIIAASILIGRALAPVEQAVGGWRGLVVARAAYLRLKALAGARPPAPQSMPLPRPRGHLVGEDIWYRPRQDNEATLKGINFELLPGEAMALVGASASGKSTLCKLLVGSWRPSKGHIRLDGADVAGGWQEEQLGAEIGYVPQDVEFLAATVKETIARLDPDPDPDAVVAAARAAGVHEAILALPHGYDTPIGPGGYFLSGGRRQMVALARALYRQPRLIVLDEPNSNLDGAGEIALSAAIRSIMAWQSTLILVTHNARLLRPVDKIMVLNNGQVQLYGGRDEVIQALRPQRIAAARPEPAPGLLEAGT